MTDTIALLVNRGLLSVKRDDHDRAWYTDFLVCDLSRSAVQLYGKPSVTATRMAGCWRMIRRPIADESQFGRAWTEDVIALRGVYEMNP